MISATKRHPIPNAVKVAGLDLDLRRPPAGDELLELIFSTTVSASGGSEQCVASQKTIGSMP
jgi:hypothetical protein